jgi:putative transposase
MSNNLVENSKTHKSLKLRIYPIKEQTILINKTFGCCRLVYNERLQERNEFYIENILPIPKENKIERAKKYKEYKPSDFKSKFPFLNEVSSQALCQSENDLKNAYNNFFKSAKGTRKGKTGFPKFKSKKNNRQSYRECMVSETALNFFSKYVKIPKLGKMAFSHDSLPKWFSKEAKLCNITVEKSCANRYYAVLLFEIDKQNYKIENRKEAIGLDFSPSEMYVSSENQTGKDFGYVAQKQKYAKNLRKLQRTFARRQMIKQENSPRKISSKNREKARIKLARLEEHIANCRRDWIEKETLRLVASYDKVVVEDLNLKGISAFLRNAKNMNDTSWGMFVSKLQAKGLDYNCNVIKADRYFPSSQLCSKCGFQYKNLKLSEREWTCSCCGTSHIRDVNAAINLMKYVPLERRKLTPADSEKISNLVGLALQAGTLEEAGTKQQATA